MISSQGRYDHFDTLPYYVRVAEQIVLYHTNIFFAIAFFKKPIIFYFIVSERQDTFRIRFVIWFYISISSASFIQRAAEASLGILQSPRGERLVLPIFTPSGWQLRLYCCEKKRR